MSEKVGKKVVRKIVYCSKFACEDRYMCQGWKYVDAIDCRKGLDEVDMVKLTGRF